MRATNASSSRNLDLKDNVFSTAAEDLTDLAECRLPEGRTVTECADRPEREESHVEVAGDARLECERRGSAAPRAPA